jgi:hypothetical protein
VRAPANLLMCIFPPVALILCLTACCHVRPQEGIERAKLDIAYMRNSATVQVSRIMQKFKGMETDERYLRARSLYDEAMSRNNSWVTCLKLGIENNEAVEKLQAFNEAARLAGNASEVFLKYARDLSEEKRVIPGLDAGVILKALVENGITLWKAFAAEKQAVRTENAARIEKELMWVRWELVR